MGKKKIFFFCILILNIFNLTLAKEIYNKPIIYIDNYIITELDLKKEIVFFKFITKSTSNLDFKQIETSSVKTLVDRKIKEIETNNFKIEILEKEIDIILYNYLKDQKITEENLNIFYQSNEIEKNYLRNITHIDLKWQKLIKQIYENKIYVNLTEIEKDLKVETENINREELKEKLIIIEKNKILNKFSDAHLKKSEKKYLIKIL